MPSAELSRLRYIRDKIGLNLPNCPFEKALRKVCQSKNEKAAYNPEEVADLEEQAENDPDDNAAIEAGFLLWQCWAGQRAVTFSRAKLHIHESQLTGPTPYLTFWCYQGKGAGPMKGFFFRVTLVSITNKIWWTRSLQHILKRQKDDPHHDYCFEAGSDYSKPKPHPLATSLITSRVRFWLHRCGVSPQRYNALSGHSGRRWPTSQASLIGVPISEQYSLGLWASSSDIRTRCMPMTYSDWRFIQSDAIKHHIANGLRKFWSDSGNSFKDFNEVQYCMQAQKILPSMKFPMDETLSEMDPE